MDLLEPHITSTFGVSFKTDQGKYWGVSAKFNGDRDIEASSQFKDIWSKFTIEKIDDYHVYLRGITGRYLCRANRNLLQPIEPKKLFPDPTCKFRVYEAGGKVVFRADSHRFLSRMERNGVQNIEAGKFAIDEASRFTVETGSLTPVKEEIESISWGTFKSPTDITPTAIGTYSHRNGGSNNVEKKFAFDRTITTTQTTNWEHSWGVTTGISYTATASVDIGLASGSTSLTLNADVRYDGKKGGNQGTTNTLKFSEQTTVIVPPKKWVTVKMMVKKVDNAEIPFTATIRRTSEIGVTRIIQKGVWRGVMVLDSYIDIQERDL